MNGIIYFAQAGDSGPIKIGFTTSSPDDRLAALQTGCPHPLRLLVTKPGTVGHERDLHSRFKQSRIAGEWFSPSDDLLKYIADDEPLPAREGGSSGPMAWIRTEVFQCGQVEFAGIAGTTQPTVSRWENGDLEPDRVNMARIRSSALGRGLIWRDEWFFETPETVS